MSTIKCDFFYVYVFLRLCILSTLNSALPNNHAEIKATKVSVAILTTVANIKMRIKPTDNVIATPMTGKSTNTTTDVTTAATIMALRINNALIKGLETSFPFKIIRVFIGDFSLCNKPETYNRKHTGKCFIYSAPS